MVDIPMQPTNALAGKRVLIAEDEAVIAMDHAALLTQAGAQVVATCATVRGAVDCIRDKQIDVAVLDYVLADGNSEPLQTALKRRHIPFVVVSAYPRPLVRTEPGQEILQKPVTSDLLCGRVEAVCKFAGLNLICVRLIRSVRNAPARAHSYWLPPPIPYRWAEKRPAK
jgi:DNA-binding NtrC family response regulator